MTQHNANTIQASTMLDVLKVMTLNLAHGRKDRWHQMLLKRRQIEEHLDHIAEVICREKPDVIALQEADGPSSAGLGQLAGQPLCAFFSLGGPRAPRQLVAAWKPRGHRGGAQEDGPHQQRPAIGA